MSFDDLPDELFHIIVKKLGDEDSNFLRSIIFTNKRGRDTALSSEILHSANILPLCMNPTSYFPGEVARTFFRRCLQHENIHAIYYEALRLITREQDVYGSLSLLNQLVPTVANAPLAYGIFQMCAGRGDISGAVFEVFFDNFAHPMSYKLYEMGEALFDDVRRFDPPGEDTFGPIWEFPETELLKSPTCSWHGEDYYCEGCYVYLCSLRICELL